MKAKFFFLLMLILPHWAAAQFFMWGQAPASIRWKEIQTENFQVIFPEGFEERAAYVADVLEFAYAYGTQTLDHAPRKVSVIIHNQTVVPNGFVSWAPRRMEMFATPPQDIGPHDWLELLAIHEFRHVVQIDKLNQGVIQLLSYLFGEQITGAIFGLFVPMWFVEGDAVAAETGQTIGGRGRMPVFEQGLRAQVLEQGPYSFDKAFFGSFRDFVPSFYSLGYQMVSHARREFGPKVFDDVLDKFGYSQFSLRPFSGRLRRLTGLSSDMLYNETFTFLRDAWMHQREQEPKTPFRTLTRPPSTFTQYRYPAFLNDSTLVALKSSLDEIPRVVALGMDGNEEILFYPGFINDFGFSAAAGKIVWSELRTHPRWEHLSWSEVFVFDANTRQKRKLTHRSRFFAPSVSPSGDMVAVVEVNERNENALVILNISDGSEIARQTPLSGDFLLTPAWHYDNETLAVIARSDAGKRILTTHYLNGSWVTVFDAGGIEISSPSFLPDANIVFTGAFSGMDALYMVNTTSREVQKMVSPEFSARNAVAAPDGATLWWQDYSSLGYALVYSPLDEVLKGESLSEVQNHSVNFYQQIAAQENFVVEGGNVPRRNHQVQPFRRFPAIFNLHSWSPVFVDIDDMTIGPGVGFYFQDVLSNSSMVIGYDYNRAEGEGEFLANFNYFGWLPVVGLTAATSTRTGHFTRDNMLFPFRYNESSLRIGANLPLSFRHHHWFFGLNPLVRAAFTRIDRARDSPDFFVGNNMVSMHYRLFAFSQRRMVARDVKPRLGNILDIQYRHSPFFGADMGSVFSARIVGFIPGPYPHHALRLSAAWQQHREGIRVPNTINLRFPNQIAYPRGVHNRYDETLTMLSADYALPLWHPDLSLPPIIYVKRVSANFFLDKAFTSNSDIDTPNESARQTFFTSGLELSVNLHLLRMFSPIEVGVRTVFLSGDPTPAYEFFWGINFY